MTPLSAVLAIVLLGATGGADRPCSPPKADARVRVSFLADNDLATLAAWAKETMCIEHTYEPSLAGRRLAQGVRVKVAGRDAGAIFEILLHTMNLRSHGTGRRRTIVASGAETPQSKAANERDKADAEREQLLANLDAEIKRKDEGHYTISRRAADVVIASLPSLARSVRVAPETKGGRPIGYRVVSFRPGAPLARLGLQVGDVVTRLNGSELTSAGKAMEAYDKLRTTGVLEAHLVRANRSLALELRIE